MLIVRNSNIQTIETLTVEIRALDKNRMQQLIDKILAYISSGHWRVEPRLAEISQCTTKLSALFDSYFQEDPSLFQVKFYTLWVDLKRAERKVEQLTAKEPLKQEIRKLSIELNSIGNKIINLNQVLALSSRKQSTYRKADFNSRQLLIDEAPRSYSLNPSTFPIHQQIPKKIISPETQKAARFKPSNTTHDAVRQVDHPEYDLSPQEPLNTIPVITLHRDNAVHQPKGAAKKSSRESAIVSEYLRQHPQQKDQESNPKLKQEFLSWLKTDSRAKELTMIALEKKELLLITKGNGTQEGAKEAKKDKPVTQKPAKKVSFSPDFEVFCIEEELTKLCSKYLQSGTSKTEEEQPQAPVEQHDDSLFLDHKPPLTRKEQEGQNFLDWVQSNTDTLADTASKLDESDLHCVTLPEAIRALDVIKRGPLGGREKIDSDEEFIDFKVEDSSSDDDNPPTFGRANIAFQRPLRDRHHPLPLPLPYQVE